MRQSIDISLARFLMILSMVLLGVLEFIWISNEYRNKYRDMEEEINQVMFSNLRDVEDSLIFTKLAAGPYNIHRDGLSVNVLISGKDSTIEHQACGFERRVENTEMRIEAKHPMRGMLLKKLTMDSNAILNEKGEVSDMVMHRIRMSDSTGEYASYEVITWQNGDTMIKGLSSRPQFDILAGKKMALQNENYRADIFSDLLPHMSFAVFLWIMVAAAFFYIWRNLRKQIQLNALRDEFVSNITHELKTPITTVGVALESLHMSGEMKTATNSRYLDICRSELNRLSLLVERILSNRAPQINYEKLDVRQVVDEVMHHMKVQFDNKHAHVQVQEDGHDFLIHGDRAHMTGVLYNLLENALKYSKNDPQIRVSLARNNGSVKLVVEDNGIGIDPGYHEKIFEKLFRVPNSNKHDVKGHGLGLSYVADVVKQHHGKIDLRSEPGKGSVFSLTLPAAN
jgi:signal transduction histidine kinase